MDRDDDRDPTVRCRTTLQEHGRADFPQLDTAQDRRLHQLDVRHQNNDWHDLKWYLLRMPFGAPDIPSGMREAKVARYFADALHDRALQSRFDGRDWDGLSVEEKVSVFTALEQTTSNIEKRDAATVHAGWLNITAGFHWTGNRIILDDYLLATEPKWTSAWAFMHEQAHAFQRSAILEPRNYPEISDRARCQWRNNVENYIHPPDTIVSAQDYIQYARHVLQPVERDAFFRQGLRLKLYEREVA